jgi:hypothetical protein
MARQAPCVFCVGRCPSTGLRLECTGGRPASPEGGPPDRIDSIIVLFHAKAAPPVFRGGAKLGSSKVATKSRRE